MSPTIDQRLVTAIQEGGCVAFVGAGFSAAAGLPRWKDLIRAVASERPEEARNPDRDLLVALLNDSPSPSNRELEMAAQLLLDAVGEDALRERLAAALHKDPVPEDMGLRLKYLRGIPFRAIVTTNFDPLLPGMPPSADAYRRLLRSRRPSPWREAIARVALDLGPPGCAQLDADAVTVQLHGRLDVAHSLVLTRSQYRRRLYADPAYLTVLRSLLATSTVLFLGYSLTDAYLNELRSELVEAFSGRGYAGEPLAWAIIEGVSEVARRYYERHEGLGVITYRKGDAGGDHSGFDAILKAVYDQTNPVHRLGELLAGRRVLWFDPNPAHNNRGRDLLRAAAAECGDCGNAFGESFVEATTLEEAWDRLSAAGKFDLVISHWGHGMCDGHANGEELLRRMAHLRAGGTAATPVVIFAGAGRYEALNRRQALGLGAAELVSRWEDLIAVLERVLAETFSGTPQRTRGGIDGT
jgi:CheY-like chemotaxis protein